MDKEIINFLFVEDLLFDSEEDYRNKEWYSNIENFSDETYNHCFRLSRNSFDSLVIKVRAKKNIGYLEKKLHLFLYSVGHVISYKRLQNLFGVSKSTVFVYIEEISDLLYDIMRE